MRSFNVWTAVACLWMSLSAARPAHAESIEPALRVDIERLMAVTGTDAAGAQMARLTTEHMLEGLRKSRPYLSERALAVAKEVLTEEFAKAYSAPDGLGARLVEIYARHFTHDEVKGLLKFYGSDLGRKTIDLMPMLMKESAAAGQEWMLAHIAKISDALDARLRAEGFLK
jgi:hypothetical protein